jgi:hypothetical protein
MTGGLYQRVSARGFPSSVAAGLTGQGALESQGAPVDPAHGQAVTDTRPSTIGPYAPDTVAPLGTVIIEGAFGLSGSYDPDQTPQAHAAPIPGWAGSYDSPDLLVMHENSTLLHSEDFGALAGHVNVHGVQGQEPQYEQWSTNDPGDNVLQPLSGQIRAMGGYDTTQGYDRRNRYGFDAGHRDRIVDTVPQPMYYMDPAERVFIVPQASGSFTPSDEYQGPGQWASGWNAESVNATPPSPYTPAPEVDTLNTPLQGGPASAGWW